MSNALADTSVFVAVENDRGVSGLPERIAVSVVTIGELELGVLVAVDDDVRARRAGTLAIARSADALPVTEAVMGSWARMVHDCRQAGITRAVRINDALIAATAVEHGLPLVTQDRGFEALARAHGRLQLILV